MQRLWLKNATLVDGTGAPPVPGDLLIEEDRIAAVGRFDPPGDALVLDCTGLAAAPGFVDAHCHSDLQVIEGRREKVVQGVTTEVVGNCSFSAFPAPEDRRPLHEFANGILRGSGDWGWASAGEYLAAAGPRAAVHVVSLVGHGTLRVSVAGNRQGPLPERDLQLMETKLAECLAEGAGGLSTGLMYAPGSSAPFEELERLCRIVARAGKIYTTHMRDYAFHLPEAVGEQIELARRTGCRLQISHLQAVGRKNWFRQQAALERIEQARDEGIDVAFDAYPYVAGSTVLTQWLPQWALDGGTETMLERFRDGATRTRIISEMLAMLAQEWTDLYVSAVGGPANQRLVGRHLSAIAEERGREPAELVLDLITEERGAVTILEFNQSGSNLRELLTHPLGIIVSDGFYVKGRPHPRLHGTFPRLMGEICRERGWLTLSAAVHKVTDAPARRFGITNRGRLEPGFFADVVVFDAAKINSPATYEEPELPPGGVRWVIREGKLVVDPARGDSTGRARGRFL